MDADHRAVIDEVVASFRDMLASDGGQLNVQGWDATRMILRVEYRKGKNPRCPECVLTEEALRTFLAESLEARGLAMEDVLVTPPAA